MILKRENRKQLKKKISKTSRKNFKTKMLHL